MSACVSVSVFETLEYFRSSRRKGFDSCKYCQRHQDTKKLDQIDWSRQMYSILESKVLKDGEIENVTSK